MTDRPAPLVPAECSMAGNDFFPFYFDRLRKSKWWRRATDIARARNVMMWGEAYKQQPAGSLPDDDDELAEAAGYGMDVDAFLAVKPEIMAPWTLCADGRWYHPTVCEVVLETWERTSDRRKSAAERQRRRRDKIRSVTSGDPIVTGDNEEIMRGQEDVTRDIGENDRDFDIQDKTVQDSTSTPQPPSGGMSDRVFDQIWTAYPEAGRKTVAKPLARQRANEAVNAGDDELVMLAQAVALGASDYIRGGGKPRRIDRWFADRLYANEPTRPTPQPIAWSGPPELWAIAVRLKGESWAQGYLGRCGCRDHTVFTDSDTLLKGVRDVCEEAFAELGYRIVKGAPVAVRGAA